MTPQLSRRIGRALAEHWVTFPERGRVIRAVGTADRWPDLPSDVQVLIVDIESRPTPDVMLREMLSR